MLSRVLLFFFFFSALKVMALEIDDKLTLRIVNTSESKKTLLINRGIEDGLVKGDHAKFFVSSGVVARGVCIKLSPTRSVWSIYRVVNAPFLAEDQVMKLKITPAVKITKDESKMLVSDDSRLRPNDPRDLGIPLAEGADDLRENEIKGTPEDVNMMENLPKVNLLKRNFEIFGMFNFSSMAEDSDAGDGVSEHDVRVTNLYMKLAGEWYFKNESEWYHRFSLITAFVMDRRAIMSHLGTELRDESNEFGVGLNLHLFDYPSAMQTFIHYLNFTFLLGSSTSSYVSGDEVGTAQEDTVNGSVINYYLAYGWKYYTSTAFGIRMELAFVQRGDEFNESEVNNNAKYVKQRIGPQFMVGLGYRF